jgi:putative pyruvate formate lyase activating enzyme
MNGFRPSYLALGLDELEQRAAEAHELLGPRCVVCPRGCKVDRREDVMGLCAIGRQAVVASYFPHFGEEDCLRGQNGSGTIFFSGCNLRCVFCAPPGTLVATDQGPKPIDVIFGQASEEIALGEGEARRVADVRVRTLTGELASVSKAFRHDYVGELVRIKPLCAPAVRLTPNHRVFAARKDAPATILEVPAAELTEDLLLLVPKRAAVEEHPVEIDVAAELAGQAVRWTKRRRRRVAAGRLIEALRSNRTSSELGADLGYHPAYVRTLRSRLGRRQLDIPLREPRTIEVEDGLVRFTGEHRPGIPARVPLDTRLAWLLGLFCAEGHVSTAADRPNSARLVFSLGPGERDLRERASQVLRDVFGVRPQTVPRRTTVTVEVGKTSVARLFLGLCGTGSAAKRVPTDLFGASLESLRAFLDGYLAGDGTETPTHLVAETVSPTLAHGLYEIGLLLGVLPSIHRWDPAPETVIEGRRVRQSPLWYVKFKRDRLEGHRLMRERTRWRDAGSHFLVPIHRVDRERYQGPVYNLEVDHPTHSYVAPALAVANCQNHDISWEVRGERTTPERLAAMMLELQAIGCHNVNWVTPEHVVPQILEALPHAVVSGLQLPIVYNTSSYDSLDSLRLMHGIVDVYMPDFKVWTRERARRYLKRPDYAEVARETVKEMHRQVGDLVLDEHGLARRGVILRHLVMPGQLDETEAILRFVAEELGTGCYVNLMAQYYPSGKVGRDGEYAEIDRHLERTEYGQALALAEGLELRLDPRSAREGRRLALA